MYQWCLLSKRADIIYNRDKIDVAFIDGLHTYEQSLSDARNCLKWQIIMDILFSMTAIL